MKSVTYSPKAVRTFLVVLLLLAVALTLRFGRNVTVTRGLLAGVEGAVAAVFLAVPKLFFPIYKILMIVTGAFGNFVFLVLSTLVFFLIVTPMSWIRKLLGKKFMPTRYDPKAPTYFEKAPEPDSPERQF